MAGRPPAVVELACWPTSGASSTTCIRHTRSPMAEDVLKRIGRLYDVEDEARGLPADRRRLICQEKSHTADRRARRRPQCDAAEAAGKNDLAAAIRYARNLWTALRRYLDDGRWRSTTTPPSAPSARSRRGVHCAPLLQVSGNIEIWFAPSTANGSSGRPRARPRRHRR